MPSPDHSALDEFESAQLSAWHLETSAFLSATAQPAEDENAARMAYIEEHGAPDSMRQIHPVQGERYWSYDQGETRYPTAAEAIDAARLKPAEVKS